MTQVDYQSLKSLKAEVASLARTHMGALQQFQIAVEASENGLAHGTISGFTHTMESRTRVSIASTATCIRSLQTCPEFIAITDKTYAPLATALKKRCADMDLKTSGLQHLNPFTVGQLTPLLQVLDIKREEHLFISCVEAAKVAAKEDGVRIPDYPANGYLTYWILNSLHATGNDVNTIAPTCLAWSQRELYRQISLFAARDDEHSDAFQLGYNLLIQHQFCRNAIPQPIFKLGLQALFNAQLPRGVWEKKDPLFVYGGLGDAYCFSFELLNSIFCAFCGEEEDLMPFEESLRRSFLWAKRSRSSKADEMTVWRSGHRVSSLEAESWATAEVYQYLRYYEQFLSKWLHKLALEELGYPGVKPMCKSDAFECLYHAEVFIPQARPKQELLLHTLLIDRVLSPLALKGETGVYSLSRHPERSLMVRSGIFFGPPGTGKTSYVKAIASYLGWPLVVLDPSDFAKNGFALIPTVTAHLFERLMDLEDAVIFFDEMDVLVHEREGQTSSGFEEKFLTTCLLPKLQDLHDTAKSLFFIATNYEKHIDEAAKREGRFDFKLQIMPPCYNEKCKSFVKTVGKDRFVELQTEFTRATEKITYATLREFQTLTDELAGLNVDDARTLLSEFNPKLLKDKEKLTLERTANVFYVKRGPIAL